MDSYRIAHIPSPDFMSTAGHGQRLSLPMHSHGDLEIVYLDRGHVTWMVNDQVVEVYGGSLFYTFPWETHGSTSEYEPGHYWHFVGLRGDEPDKRSGSMSFRRLGFNQAEDAEVLRILKGSAQRSWPASERIAMTIRELVQETLKPTAWSEKIRPTLGKFLLLELARIISDGMAQSPPEVKFPPKVKKLLQELRAHPEKKWTLPEMAISCGQHQTYFINAVRQLTGDTPMRYLRRVRIDLARELLQGDRAITQVAFDCGFESSQHFARIFREFTGQSASEYRKNPDSGILLKER